MPKLLRQPSPVRPLRRLSLRAARVTRELAIRLEGRIQTALTPDLLKPAWRARAEASGRPFVGHCYVAAEAAYHILGGKRAGWVPRCLNRQVAPGLLQEGGTHWFIQHRATGVVVDPTSCQFSRPVPHKRGLGAGFLTRRPSRRTRIVLRRLGAV